MADTTTSVAPTTAAAAANTPAPASTDNTQKYLIIGGTGAALALLAKFYFKKPIGWVAGALVLGLGVGWAVNMQVDAIKKGTVAGG